MKVSPSKIKLIVWFIIIKQELSFFQEFKQGKSTPRIRNTLCNKSVVSECLVLELPDFQTNSLVVMRDQSHICCFSGFNFASPKLILI